MSAEIVAVLAVLDGTDPGGLAKVGAFWAGPPIAYNSDTCGHPSHIGWREHNDVRWHCYMCQHPARALVLWWDGKLVPEGWDRARRAYRAISREIDDHYGTADVSDPYRFVVESFADQMVRVGHASRVVRLARDDSDRLVEVTP